MTLSTDHTRPDKTPIRSDGHTRRFFLRGVSAFAAVAVLRSPISRASGAEAAPPAPTEVAAPLVALPAPVTPRPPRPTELEVFLKGHGIGPAHLAREAGYCRQHLLRIRMGRIEPTPLCAVSLVRALRRISREPLILSRVFEQSVVVAAQRTRKAVLRKFHPFERKQVRKCFG